MLVNEFLKEIEKTYNNYFKNSKCVATLQKNIYNSIDITCFIANSEKEVYNQIWENDMLKVRFTIDTEKGEFNKDITETSNITDNLKLEACKKSYLTVPKNQYYVYNMKQLAFRKTTGSYNKILTALDKFFKKLYEELKSDLENNLIHKNHIELLKNKL